MSVAVKICGLRDREALHAAIEGGAGFLGFVFVPHSKRVIAPDAAQALLATLPHPTLCRFQHYVEGIEETEGLVLTALFADASDAEIAEACKTLAPFVGLIQLHGNETPARVKAIRKATGLPVMKAIPIATEADFRAVPAFEKVADMLLFDTKPAKGASGGTGESFDWSLLTGRTFKKPWMLAGGLTAKNIKRAIKQSGATIIDLSSGVETDGKKDAGKIKEVLGLCPNITTGASHEKV